MKQHDATTYTKHHCKDHLLSEAEMLQKEYELTKSPTWPEAAGAISPSDRNKATGLEWYLTLGATLSSKTSLAPPQLDQCPLFNSKQLQ